MDDDAEAFDPAELCDQPLNVAAHRNAVILNGPGKVTLALTAKAAARSGKQLLKAAAKARRFS